MRWTHEKPTEAAWYWFRYHDSLVNREAREVFELCRDGSVLRVTAEEDWTLDELNGEFAGPVPPPDANWTREKPTQSGWYWYRHGEGVLDEEVREVIEIHAGSVLRVAMEMIWPLEELTGAFAGPIPPPEDSASEKTKAPCK